MRLTLAATAFMIAAREPNEFGPRDWDARGDLGCARRGQPMQSAACAFKVIRYLSEQGATVYVRTPGRGDAPPLNVKTGRCFQMSAW